jgi:hypothetical protein
MRWTRSASSNPKRTMKSNCSSLLCEGARLEIGLCESLCHLCESVPERYFFRQASGDKSMAVSLSGVTKPIITSKTQTRIHQSETSTCTANQHKLSGAVSSLYCAPLPARMPARARNLRIVDGSGRILCRRATRSRRSDLPKTNATVGLSDPTE